MERIELKIIKNKTIGWSGVIAKIDKDRIAADKKSGRGSEIIIGADPGITGAIAFIGKHYTCVVDMPFVAKSTGKGNQVDQYALCHIFRKAASFFKIKFAYVERVHAMPNQGVTSVFSFGRSMGVLETALAAAAIPVVLITPQAWKKSVGLIKKEKDAARILAMQKYPELAKQLSRKKDIGRADAILIAYYGSGIG